MHLIQEQQRRTALSGTCLARRLDRRADILDSGHNRREGDELRAGGLRDETRERRLAGAGRPPQDERVQLACLDAGRQRLPGTEQVALPDEFGELARPHAVRERAQRIVHLRGVPMTSAPAGGLKLTSAGRTGPLRSTFWKTMVAV